MRNYKIFKTNEFIKKFNTIDKRLFNVISKKLKNQIYPQLKKNPYYGPHIKKLRDTKQLTLRHRTGDFRIFYYVSEKDKIVYILSIDNRKDAYK